MIRYAFHPIGQDVTHGRNAAMEIHFVLTIVMKRIVQIGGVIQIMEHFFVII